MRLENLGPGRAAALLVVAILAQAAGNVCLSIAMKQVGALLETGSSQWLAIAGAAIGNPVLIAGVILLAVFFLLFAYLLSHLDLTVAMPVISFEVVLNVACGYWFLHETVSAQRWLGTILVSTGVALVGATARRKSPGTPRDQAR